MAEIRLEALRHAYTAHPTRPSDYALKEIDLAWQDGGAYALLGPSGCGKTTLLNIISGLVVPSEGRVLFDGRDVTRLRADRAQHRPGVPVPGHLRHDDGLREPRLPAEEPRRPARRRRGAGPRHRRPARARPDARPPRLRPLARQQAEDLDGPRARPRGRQRHHVRRAADRHRPAPEVAAALQAQGAAPARRRDDDLRHPRPDRGADLRRPGRGHAGRRRRAGRLAGRPLRAPGAYLRRPLHRLAGHEHPALRGRRRPRPLRRPPGRHRQPCRRPGRRPARARRPPRVRRARRPTASRPRSSASPTSAAAASSRRSPATAASTPSSTRTAPVALGPAHLAFDPAQTRIYVDGWLAEGRP